ncbi:LLM class flavin-dependent oxidoreductase [Streptomyces sp. NPDC028635]|uniref:LLM class flavin-dependent oxidoreductase n=1 Tax=Streptomyces sp. NPDC028635 TaxID=3154800 RepID=UPI0033C07CFC
MGGLLHLGAAIDQPRAYDAGAYVELARLAERGGLDFVTVDGGFAGPGLDTAGVLARVAPETTRIGLVPAVTDPDREAGAVAVLDRISAGRAGRLARTTGTPGRSPGHPVHVVDATDRQDRPGAARHADVALVRAAGADQAADLRAELAALATGYGRDPRDLRVLASLRIDLGDGERAAAPGHGGGGPRPTVHGPLYRGGPVDLAELITGWHAHGAVDGFHLVPVEPRRDLERLVNGTVAVLQHRGLFRTFYPGGTLREHLGLARAVRYAGSVG